MERCIAKRCGNGPESDGADRHSVHKELIVLHGALESARARGTFRAVVADVVPPFKSGYVPRETFLTPDQFMALSKNLIVPRTNPKPAAVARKHDRRIKRTSYLLLAGLARVGREHSRSGRDREFRRGIHDVQRLCRAQGRN